MNKKKKIVTITMIAGMITIVLSLMTVASAMTFATSMGTTCLGLNTFVHMSDAANAYIRSGYSNTHKIMDPDYILLVSNLAGEVQYFATHGNYDNIRFKDCGINLYNNITIGNTEYIGTNNVNLWQNSLLVTYAACCTAGVDGKFQYDSITYETATRGAEAVVGFKDNICQECLDFWSYRYNSRLSNGYGVLESAEYANTFSYEHNSIKDFHVVHHGDANIKIGTYNNNSSLNIARESRNVINLSSKKIEATDENIIHLLKQQNNNFNTNDVKITRNYGGSTNVITGETELIEYIDIKEKIGGYITNSGFTVVCNNGVIEKIFDNTIEKNKTFRENIHFEQKNNNDTEKLKQKAINDALEKYKNIKVIKEDTEIEYYYDIENNKKYVLVTVKTDAGEDGKAAYGIDTFKYEI